MTIQRRTRHRYDPYNAVLPAFSDFLTELSNLTPWTGQAACRDSEENFIEAYSDAAVLRCLELCARCPVRRECLEHAFSFPEEWGVWGGTSTTERRHARSKYGERAKTVLEGSFQERLVSHRREVAKGAQKRTTRAKKAHETRRARKTTAA